MQEEYYILRYNWSSYKRAEDISRIISGNNEKFRMDLILLKGALRIEDYSLELEINPKYRFSLTATASGHYVVDSAMKNLIEEFSDFTQFIPFKLIDRNSQKPIEDVLWMFYTYNQSDIFDLSESSRQSKGGRIKRLRMKKDSYEVGSDFRRDAEHNLIIVSSKFKAAADLRGLTGIEFVKVQDYKH